jgi:hypothetical protein
MSATTKTTQLILLITLCLFTQNAFATATSNQIITNKAGVFRILESTCPKSTASCEGSCTWSDGSTYQGEFVYGLPQGFGEQNWPDGSYYEGKFEEGYRHGKGTQLLDNGDQYIGQFERGFMTGHGTYIWADGTMYKGEYKNDEMNGFGTITYTNGASYEGTWKDGVAHGKGVFITAGGARFVGNYKKGKRHGEGVMTFLNGAILTGNWYNGFLVKEGLFKFEDGDGFWANWKQAEQDGKVKYNSFSKKNFITLDQDELLNKLSKTEKANMSIVYYFIAIEYTFDKQYQKAISAFEKALSLVNENDPRYDAIKVDYLLAKNKSQTQK